MSEFRGESPAELVLRPDYWGGIDIFGELPPNSEEEILALPEWKLHKKCTQSLSKTLRRVKVGDYTEVSYLDNLPFNPEPARLPDGTVIALEREQLIVSDFDFDSVFMLQNSLPPIYRPYGDYWRANRKNPFCGVNVVGFEDYSAVYERRLFWGVVHSDATHGRMLQKYPFRTSQIDGFSRFLPTGRIYGELLNPQLPINVGEARTLSGGDIRLVGRISRLDVIYPGKAEKADKEVSQTLGGIAISTGSM